MQLWKRNGPMTECTGKDEAEIVQCDRYKEGKKEVICLNRRKHGSNTDDLCQCISEETK